MDLYILNDGEQALQFFRQIDQESIRCPDMLLLDLNIPRFDGFHVLGYLRKLAQCTQMPAIVMTSSAAPADKTRSAACNVSAYFNKPSTYAEFLEIGDIIRKHL